MTDQLYLAAEAAASGQPSLLRILSSLLAIVVVARLAGEFAERVGLPTVLAEIAAGVLLGGSVLGWVEPSETFHVLAEIGAILLLFEVGLHMDLGDLARVGSNASRAALIGIVAPAAATYPLAIAMGIERDPAIFLAAAVTATSVGITARVFAEMKVLATPEARTVLGAAVIDDVLGLLILTFVTQTLGTQIGEGRSIAMTTALALGFLVIGGAVAILGAPRYFEFIGRWTRTEGALVVGTFGFALAVAAAGAWAGLAPLVGSFLAGVAAARSDRSADFQRQIAPVGHLIVPIFFVFVGLEMDVAALGDISVVLLALAVSAVAIITKAASGLGVFGGKTDRLLVGLGMIPRGEVGLIFATLGLSSGILDDRTHATLVLVVLITTVVTPPMLRWRLRRRELTAEATQGEVTAVADCLRADAGVVNLAGPPSPEDSLVVVLRAARLLSENKPSPQLVEWLRSGPVDVPVWDDAARAELFALLERGRDRSFKLLESTGVFAKLFPLIAAAPKHAIDPYGLDPDNDAIWDGVLDLQNLLRDGHDPASQAADRLEDRRPLWLAAFARGSFDGPDAGDKGRRLAESVGLPPAAAEEVGDLVAERRLLPAAALEPDLGVPEPVLELAAHLGSDRLATALYVLAVSENRSDRETRARIDELYGLVHAALTDEQTGGDVLGARRAAVRAAARDIPGELLAEHLDEAPRRYLLAFGPETIALHMGMLDPAPSKNELRMVTQVQDGDTTRIHVVVRDRLGALAALAHALNDEGFKIGDASAAVWPTGIAILVFDVTGAQVDTDDLRPKLERALLQAESLPGVGAVEGHIAVDNHASPWYSIVEVRAPDRHGLLARVASAISAAGADIVSATATTTEGVARDRFFVVGPDGGKLTRREERTLRSALEGQRPATSPKRQ